MRVVAGTVAVESVDAFVERLGAVGADHAVTVQAFDARYVVDRGHLERAVELADRAIDRGENVADDRAVEILLYAAGRRQINRAFGMGVSEGTNRVVVLVDDPGVADTLPTADEQRAATALRETLDIEAVDDDGSAGIGDYDPERARDFFDVGEAELAAVEGGLPDLVRERVALLDVEK